MVSAHILNNHYQYWLRKPVSVHSYSWCLVDRVFWVFWGILFVMWLYNRKTFENLIWMPKNNVTYASFLIESEICHWFYNHIFRFCNCWIAGSFGDLRPALVAENLCCGEAISKTQISYYSLLPLEDHRLLLPASEL